MDRSKFGSDITSEEFETEYLQRVSVRLDACIAEASKWANQGGYGHRIHVDEFDFHNCRRVEAANRRLTAFRKLTETGYHSRVDFKWSSDNSQELIYIGLYNLQDRDDEFLIYDWRAPICALNSKYESTGPAQFEAPGGLQRGKITLKRTYNISPTGLSYSTVASGNPSKTTGEPVTNQESKATAVVDARYQDTASSVDNKAGITQLECEAHGNQDRVAFNGATNEKAIRNAEVTSDEMLATMLSRNTTGSMQQIVRSIQGEQDSIIRDPGRIMAIQGPAGSGKSVIAIHRASHMLYHMRQAANDPEDFFGRFSASKVMVFTPNNAFSAYISSVMPSLMEDNIRTTVLLDMLPDELAKVLQPRGGTSYTIERTNAQNESVQQGTLQKLNDVRVKGMKFKSSLEIYEATVAFIHEVEEYIKSLFVDIYYRPVFSFKSRNVPGKIDVEMVISRDAMLNAFSSFAEIPLNERINEVLNLVDVKTALLNKTRNTVVGQGNNELALKKLEVCFKPVHDELVRLRNTSPLRWYALFLRYLESGELGDLAEASKTTAPGKVSVAVNRVLRRRQAVTNAGRSAWIEATIKSITKRTVMCEDVLPIMFLRGFIHGFPNFNGVIHAVIDEAQDYSILHYRYLRTLLPETCTITIVGDPYQAINPVVRTTDFQALLSVFPECIITPALEYSYRSSREITEFAAALLPGSPEIKNVRSTHVVPQLVKVASGKTPDVIGTLVRQLNRDGYPSVGVVCKSCAEAEALYDVLGRSLDVTLLNDKTTEFSVGNYVAPLIYAKGLEFDAVIVADASNRSYRSEMDRLPLYTACTRALHRLYLCYEKARSPLLPPEAKGLFELRKLAGIP